MVELKVYARDKNGNRGPLMFTNKYPTQEQAEVAKRSLIWLCINQRKFSKEWNLKQCVPVVN